MTVHVEPAADDAGPNRNWAVKFEYMKGSFTSGTLTKKHVSYHKTKQAAISKAKEYGLSKGDNQVLIHHESGGTETQYARRDESSGRENGGSDRERAERFHAQRSGRAVTVDEQKRASNQTTDYETWAANPRRLDFPGVDTPPEPQSDERPAIGSHGDVNERDEFGRATWGLPPLEERVGEFRTERLFDLRDSLFDRRSKAREAQKAKGRTAGRETIEDDMMRGYLSDVRTIEDELYERGEL